MQNGEDLILHSKDYVMTESLLDPKISPDRLLEILRERKTTGHVTFNLNSGGISNVTVVEKKKA